MKSYINGMKNVFQGYECAPAILSYIHMTKLEIKMKVTRDIKFFTPFRDAKQGKLTDFKLL